MTRAALYLRISQDATGEHLGVTRQREDCEELAKRNGWEIAETYIDNDTSAYKDRPQFDRMLSDIAAGHLDAIVAWAPDRIYRRARQLEDIIDFIEKHKVEIRTVKAGDLDLSSAYGRMLARILGSVAAGEGEIKSERWKRSWRQRREAGDFAANGHRTFGYTREGHVVEDEAKVARWMAGKILTGTPILTVAREMQALGLCTSLGNEWTPQQIKRYLTNPRLAGWSHMNGEIVGEGSWEPLLDRDTFEATRALLQSRTRAYVPRKSILGRLIHCGLCDTKLITSGQKGTRTYRCPSRPGMNGCGRCSCNAEPAEQIVETYARARLLEPATRAAIGELRAEGDGGPRSELAAIEMRIVELEKQLDDPALPLAAILRAIERAKERQAELAAVVASRSLTPIPTSEADWPTDIAHRRALIDLVVEKVILHPATRASRVGFDVERVEIVGRI